MSPCILHELALGILKAEILATGLGGCKHEVSTAGSATDTAVRAGWLLSCAIVMTLERSVWACADARHVFGIAETLGAASE